MYHHLAHVYLEMYRNMHNGCDHELSLIDPGVLQSAAELVVTTSCAIVNDDFSSASRENHYITT